MNMAMLVWVGAPGKAYDFGSDDGFAIVAAMKMIFVKPLGTVAC